MIKNRTRRNSLRNRRVITGSWRLSFELPLSWTTQLFSDVAVYPF
jgi:hypothetical protein